MVLWLIFTRPSGIICGGRSQVRARRRRRLGQRRRCPRAHRDFVHLQLVRVLRDGTVTTTRGDKVSGEVGGEVGGIGNWLDVPHDRMVSGNKDEAADAHLVDALCESEEGGVRRRRWERRGREAGVLSERLSAV